MDPIDRVIVQTDLKHIQLTFTNRNPKIKIDERGFVNLARQLFKSLKCRATNTCMRCSDLEFVYYFVALLRAQQFQLYGLDNLPYDSDEVFNFVARMEEKIPWYLR